MEFESREARQANRAFGQDVSNVVHNRGVLKGKDDAGRPPMKGRRRVGQAAPNNAGGAVEKPHRYNLRSRTKAQRKGASFEPLGKENQQLQAPLSEKVPMSVDSVPEEKPRKRRGRKRTAADMDLESGPAPQKMKTVQEQAQAPPQARNKRRQQEEPDPCQVSKWDEAQINNDLAVPLYVNDIVAHLKQAECLMPVPPPSETMKWQKDINLRMRTILLDWLVEVHRKFQLLAPSLYLCVNLLDRYLAKRQVPRSKLQLVGCACLWVACKYHEIYAPEMNDFTYISDNAFSTDDLIATESTIVATLEFGFTVATPLAFAERYLKVGVAVVDERRLMQKRRAREQQRAKQRRGRRRRETSATHPLDDDEEKKETEEERQHRVFEASIVRNLTLYVMEHALMDPETSAQLPSRVAAACLAYALLGTKLADWTPDLEETTGYQLHDVLPVMVRLDGVLKNPKCKHKAVRKKYLHSKYEKVAQINFEAFDVQRLAKEATEAALLATHPKRAA